MNNSENLILLDNINKSFENKKALENISLKIKKNEIFGLIGPDGAGKSTLFRILATLYLPDSGTVEIDDIDVIKDYKKIRNIIGYMPGRFSLYQDLSVEENLNFFADVFDVNIKENYFLIKNIYSQIEPFKKRKAGKLSGGMKQKLALCCALIHRPEVLILDEPTTGVDPVSRKEFWEILKILREQNITIVVSTPYMDEASLCDRVGLIFKGNLLKIDEPQKIVNSFEKKIISVKAENSRKLLNDIRNFSVKGDSFAFGGYVHYIPNIFDNENNLISVLEKFLKDKGHKKIEASYIEPTIEDCFMEFSKEFE